MRGNLGRLRQCRFLRAIKLPAHLTCGVVVPCFAVWKGTHSCKRKICISVRASKPVLSPKAALRLGDNHLAVAEGLACLQIDSLGTRTRPLVLSPQQGACVSQHSFCPNASKVCSVECQGQRLLGWLTVFTFNRPKNVSVRRGVEQPVFSSLIGCCRNVPLCDRL